MATPVFMEPGTDATHALDWQSLTTSGTVVSDTVQSKTGPRSIKCSSPATPAAAYVKLTAVLANAGRRWSVYYRFSDLPSSDTAIMQIKSTAGNDRFQLRLRTGGSLDAHFGAAANNGTDVLSINTWYRITVSYTVTSTSVSEWRVFVNGTLDITVSNPTLAGTTLDDLFLGWCVSPGNETDIWIDDEYGDDGSTLDDIASDVRITYKAPTAVNLNEFDTTNGSGAVNERPVNAANGMQHDASTDKHQTYGLQSRATGDVDITWGTVIALCAFGNVQRVGTGGTGTAALTLNGVDYTTTFSTAAGIVTKYLTTPTYPTDASTIGVKSTATTADTILNDCGVLVAYTPGAAPNVIGPFPTFRH